MVDKRYNCILFEELSDEECSSFFDLKSGKFLPNIDTFYYSVKLADDFTFQSTSHEVKNFRRWLSQFDKLGFGEDIGLGLPDIDPCVCISHFKYSKYYEYRVSYPDMYDIFIAPKVPGNSETLDSTTSEIIVQLRSKILWEFGPYKAYEIAFDTVYKICNSFGLTIVECKENRVDYAWHSNYLQNPEKFLRIDNFVDMAVHRYKGANYHYSFKRCKEYENDYVALGNRGDNIFIRIYLKSKEVVEQGYKPWFFQIWRDNEMISEYDKFCFEYAFSAGKWNALQYGRLMFYIQHGKNEKYIQECRDIISQCKPIDDKVVKLADKLTPRPTLIINIEFQVMRKASKRFMISSRDGSEASNVVNSRIYTVLDNTDVIAEYLTHSCLRFVDSSTNKKFSKCSYNKFWSTLRSSDWKYMKFDEEAMRMRRDYSRELTKQLVKTKMYNSVINYNFYDKGYNEDHVLDDCINALLKMNDNDLARMSSYKNKRLERLSMEDFMFMEDESANVKRFKLVDVETGEEYDFREYYKLFY